MTHIKRLHGPLTAVVCVTRNAAKTELILLRSQAEMCQSQSGDRTLYVDDIVLQHTETVQDSASSWLWSNTSTASPVRVSFISAVSDNSVAMSHYTRLSIWFWLALILSRLDYCNSVLTKLPIRHCRECGALQLDSSGVCRHVITSVLRWRNPLVAGRLPHPLQAGSCDV